MKQWMNRYVHNSNLTKFSPVKDDPINLPFKLLSRSITRVAKTPWTSHHLTKQLKTFLTHFCNNYREFWPKHYLFSNFCTQNRGIGFILPIKLLKLLKKGPRVTKWDILLINLSYWTETFLSITGTKVPVFLRPCSNNFNLNLVER